MTDEYVEVPITRRARVSLIGTVDLHIDGRLLVHLKPGELLRDDDWLVVRPEHGPFRAGIARVFRDHLGKPAVNFFPIAAATYGDLLYRVDPP